MIRLAGKILFCLVLAIAFCSFSCKKKAKVALADSHPVSDLTAYPGRNRVKLSWQLPNANMVAECRVFWNNHQDSITVHVSDNADTATVLINELTEGSYIFMVKAYSKTGDASAAMNVHTHAYGEAYEDSLHNRIIKTSVYNVATEQAFLNWNNAESGAVATVIKYGSGAMAKTMIIKPNENSDTLADFDIAEDGLLIYRTCYLPEASVIDTFYSAYDSVKIQTTAGGKLLWNGDASGGNAIWKVAQNIDGEGAITVVNDPTYGPVWKFYKPLGSHRTEAHAAKGFQTKEGDDIYIGWRSKLSIPVNTRTNAVFQWKAYGDNMLQNYPIVFSTTSDGYLHLMHFAPGKIGTEVWKTPLKINAWNRFVLRLKISRDGNIGFIELWYNDKKQTLAGGTERFYGRTLDAEYCDPKWGVYGGDAQSITNYVGGLRIATTYELVKPAKLPEPPPDPPPAPAQEPLEPPDLLLNKTVSSSSELSSDKASDAVDGDKSTYWQPLHSDRLDNNNIWMSADMGSAQTFNAAHLFWNRADIIAGYKILYSDDGNTWQVAYEKTSGISTHEKVSFAKVTARYVKLSIDLNKDANLTTFEWRLFKE